MDRLQKVCFDILDRFGLGTDEPLAAILVVVVGAIVLFNIMLNGFLMVASFFFTFVL